MEMLEFCIEVIKREAEKFHIDIDYSTAQKITAATADSINYDIAHNRCAFMYRCGTINLSFAKDCFGKFMSEYKDIFTLLFRWYVNSNLTLCTISKGPALDYLALLLFCYEKATYQPLFKNIKVISKYGAWRNTINIMQKVISEGYLKCLPTSVSIGNIEVIQGDPLQNFCEKTKSPIGNSDVMLMVKALNLQSDSDTKAISKPLQEIFDALKPNAFLFCIDTRPSTALIISELLKLPGTFLYEPAYMNTIINVEFIEQYKNNLGCSPVLSARGSFFVWQKSPIVLSKADTSYLSMNKHLEINKILEDMNNNGGHFNESSDISDTNKTQGRSDLSGMSSSFSEILEKRNELNNKSQLEFFELESGNSSAEYMCTDTQKLSEVSLKANVGYLSPDHFESNKSLVDTCLNPEKTFTDVDQTKQLKIRNFSNISSISSNFNEMDKESSFSKQASTPPGKLHVSSASLNAAISLCSFTNKTNPTLSNKNLGNYSCSFVDKCVQTDAHLLEAKIHTTYANDINSLQNKILKLTSVVNELIKADQLQKDGEKKYVENSAEFCKHSAPNSFHMSCIHKSRCNSYIPSCFISKCCGRKDVETFKCNHAHDRMSCTHHQNVHCATSHNGFQAAKHPCSSHDDNTINPKVHDGPNLVIPLNNLHSDIVLQIISLLSKNDS